MEDCFFELALLIPNDTRLQAGLFFEGQLTDSLGGEKIGETSFWINEMGASRCHIPTYFSAIDERLIE